MEERILDYIPVIPKNKKARFLSPKIIKYLFLFEILFFFYAAGEYSRDYQGFLNWENSDLLGLVHIYRPWIDWTLPFLAILVFCDVFSLIRFKYASIWVLKVALVLLFSCVACKITLPIFWLILFYHLLHDITDNYGISRRKKAGYIIFAVLLSFAFHFFDAFVPLYIY